MKLSQTEIVGLVGLIGYIAFFSHPPPGFIQAILNNPVGQALVLLIILYTATSYSFILAFFAAIAYLISSNPVTEYLDEKEQKPTKKQPAASGIPSPAITGMLNSLLNKKKGDRVPQAAGKSVKTPPPTGPVPPKPTSAGKEHFSAF